MTAEPIRSMAPRYYTDPEIAKAERSGLLSRTWQFAMHSADIPNPGDYCAFDVAGESLFASRGRDGAARVFYNVCQHRANEMVSGTGNTRVLVCPNHAWAYELTGALRAGPNISTVHGLDKSDICLTEVRCEDFHGFLFVNLDENAAPMDEWFPGVREELAAYVPDINRLVPLEWVEAPENCNWKVSVENYSECYHCPMNHPTFAKGVIKPETYDIRPLPQGHVLRHTTECQGPEAMTYLVDLDANEHAGENRSWFLVADVLVSVLPGKCAQHLSLARDRLGPLHCLARLVHRRRRGKRRDPPSCRAGPGNHRRRRHPAGRKRASWAEIARLRAGAAGD
jgi:carnitine monooxygenase subunit